MKRATFVGWLLAIAGIDACARSSERSSMAGMMSSGRGRGEMSGMMGSTDQSDMRIYMEMFDHHREIRRTVHVLKDGVRTVTESSNPRIAALLQAHVSKMYDHVERHEEVRCMSDTLPTMFRNASKYQRRLTMTSSGVAVEETSDDAAMVAVLQRHAKEVTGFVEDGMPAMMRGMTP